jgi:hypothetical protein
VLTYDDGNSVAIYKPVQWIYRYTSKSHHSHPSPLKTSEPSQTPSASSQASTA